ncbi:MAG: glycosyltransferase [Chthoniobacterales bacterium]
MRIFYAVVDSPNPQFRSYLWRKNLRDALVKLGHEVVDFDFDLEATFQNLDPADPSQAEFIRQNRPRLSEALLDQMQKAHARNRVDLLFTYFYNACVLPGTIRQIASQRTVTLNWFCNASYQFHLVSEIAPEYQFCLVPEKSRLADYRLVGANPIYCQEAANPDVYRPYPEEGRYDAGFVGQAYGERPGLVQWLIEQRVDVQVWGAGWEFFRKRRPSLKPARWGNETTPKIPGRFIGGVLSDEDLVRTFSRTKVNLGFAACWTEERSKERITQVRLRDFEVPMSGGFYLTEYQEELGEFFDVDSEIACYRSKEELLEKIHFYLKRPHLRNQIRQAGRRRCLNDHTWEKRFERVFREIGLTK